MTFFCSSCIGYGLTKNGGSSFNFKCTSINGHVPLSSLRLNTLSILAKNSSLPLSSYVQSDKLSFIWSISASVMCHHLSSGSNQGYLSSCVGTFVSSVVTSVQVEIHGISAGSIGLSYAIGLGLRVTGVTLSCRYWSTGKCFELLICTRPFDLASKYATS